MKIQPLPVPFSGDKFMSRAKNRLPGGRPALQFRKKEKGEEKEKKKGRKEKNAFPVPFGTFGRGGVIIQMGRLEMKGKIRIPDSRKY